MAHLEAKGHDALHASKAGLGTEDDSVILERARIDGRIVVTRRLACRDAGPPRSRSAQSDTLGLDRLITVVDQHRIRRRSVPIKD